MFTRYLIFIDEKFKIRLSIEIMITDYIFAINSYIRNY